VAALTYSPIYPVPKFQTTVTFSLTQSGSDFIRVWCTMAPTGSELDGRINSSRDPRNRVVVFEGSPATAWNNVFDMGGKYTFVAQEYLKGSGYGGGYAGDPNTADNEEKIGSEATLTIHVGQRVTQPIGPQDNQATLVLWVWDDYIHRTTKAFHGEDSPAITSASPTPAVKTAMESASVDDALDALVDVQINDLSFTTVGDITTWTSNIYDAFNAHFDNTPDHANVDTYNVLTPAYAIVTDEKSYIAFVKQALKALRQHVTNDTGTSTDPPVGPALYGPDSAEFHNIGGENKADTASVPLYQTVTTFAEAYGALADISRCFALHQANETVHDGVSIYPVLALPLIQQVHSAFLSVLADATPAPPPAQSDGVQTLLSLAGFKET